MDNERVTKSCQSHSRAQAIFTVCPTKNVSNFSIFRRLMKHPPASFLPFSSHWRHFFFSLGLSPTSVYTHKLPFFFEPTLSDHLYNNTIEEIHRRELFDGSYGNRRSMRAQSKEEK